MRFLCVGGGREHRENIRLVDDNTLVVGATDGFAVTVMRLWVKVSPSQVLSPCAEVIALCTLSAAVPPPCAVILTSFEQIQLYSQHPLIVYTTDYYYHPSSRKDWQKGRPSFCI